MDSFEMTKVTGAVLGTVFVLFGGSLIAEGLFHSEIPETAGYAIVAAEPEAAGEAGAEPAAAVPVATLLASADPEAGAAQFKKCQACHSGEDGGANKVGPNLWSIVNRPIASGAGFSYSAALRGFAEGGAVPWDFEHLNGFILNPKGYVSGTAMGFAGIKDDKDRADLLAYLNTLSATPAPLPEAPAAEAAPAAEEAPAAATAPADAAAAPGEGDPAPSPAAAPVSGATAAPAAEPAPAAETAASTEAPATPAPAAPVAADPTPAAAPVPAAPAPVPAPPAAPAPAPADPAPAAAAAPAAPASQEVAAATGDAKAGAQVFKKCQACHAVGAGAANKVGPELNGIVGEATAAVEGYSFSPALKKYAEANPVWTEANLTAWLTDPKGTVPGTKMAYPGLKKPADVANVIAYLKSFDEAGAPAP